MIINKEIKVDTFSELLKAINPNKVSIGLENVKEPNSTQQLIYARRKGELVNGIILTVKEIELIDIVEIYRLELSETCYTFIRKDENRHWHGKAREGLVIGLSLYNEVMISCLPKGYNMNWLQPLEMDLCKR